MLNKTLIIFPNCNFFLLIIIIIYIFLELSNYNDLKKNKKKQSGGKERIKLMYMCWAI